MAFGNMSQPTKTSNFPLLDSETVPPLSKPDWSQPIPFWKLPSAATVPSPVWARPPSLDDSSRKSPTLTLTVAWTATVEFRPETTTNGTTRSRSGGFVTGVSEQAVCAAAATAGILLSASGLANQMACSTESPVELVSVKMAARWRSWDPYIPSAVSVPFAPVGSGAAVADVAALAVDVGSGCRAGCDAGLDEVFGPLPGAVRKAIVPLAALSSRTTQAIASAAGEPFLTRALMTVL